MKYPLFILAILLFTSNIFAKDNNLILLLSQKQDNLNQLNNEEKLYSKSLLQTLTGDLTLVKEITIRTESNDADLRQIQKKSQIEAARGLGSESSYYQSDLVSKADLEVSVNLIKYKQGWKIGYSISNIESLNIIAAGNSEKYFQLDNIDEETDKIAWAILSELQKRGYINSPAYSVRTQLLHEADTEENYRRYILEYEERSSELQQELDTLKKKNMTAEERAKAEIEERAIRLKIEMTERKKALLEANEKNRKAEEELAKKRQIKVAELTEKQRNDFQITLSKLEAKRSEILKESARSLPLKKRIELIEADRNNLESFKTQLQNAVNESNSYFDNQKQKEINAKNSEPWRKADLSDGKPSAAAKEFRKAEIRKINVKWDSQKKAAEQEILSGPQDQIAAYEKAIASATVELEKTEFLFRSIEKNEKYITLNVDEYDASSQSWTVHTFADFYDIPQLVVPYNKLPDIEIGYESMTGTDIPDSKDLDMYNNYRDSVERSDLYFRTSVPYVYASLSLKVKYDKVKKNYKANYISFTITKTENNQVIYKSGKELLQSSAQGKHFMQNQKPRKGIFINPIFGKSFLYDYQLGNRISGFWGNKFFFAGGGVSFFVLDYSNQYSGRFDKGTLLKFEALAGACVTIFRFRPYIECGTGYYFTQADSKNNKENIKTPHGFCANLGGGADYFLTNNISIGAFYYAAFDYGCGFADNFGIGAGWNF